MLEWNVELEQPLTSHDMLALARVDARYAFWHVRFRQPFSISQVQGIGWFEDDFEVPGHRPLEFRRSIRSSWQSKIATISKEDRKWQPHKHLLST